MFAHGIMENSTRFNHFFQELCGKYGCTVYAMDHRNHGRSTSEGAPPSCYIGEWAEVTGDLGVPPTHAPTPMHA